MKGKFYMRAKELINYTLALTFALAISATYASDSFDVGAFETDLREYSAKYQDFLKREASTQLLLEGYVSRYYDELRGVVPDAEKNVFDYFFVGNLLYAQEPQASYAYMKTAETLQPDNPHILLERGIHEHRAGNCSAAFGYYRRFHETSLGKRTPVSWAYRAHCALLLGDYEDALGAWQRANFARNHTSIEKGMYTIFATSRPDVEREKLVARIHAGEHQLLCDLIDHDSKWELDWWNYAPKKDYLRFDRALADRVLVDDSFHRRLFEFCTRTEPLKSDEYLQALNKLQIWGEEATLPESSAVVYDVIRRLTTDKLATPDEVLRKFEPQMQQRLATYPGDRRLLDVLGYLYATTGRKDDLRQVDYHGWHELRVEKFASSYILGLDPSSVEFDSRLAAALVDFPNSKTLNQIRMARRAKSAERIEAMAHYVASEFANVANNWSGPYRLHDFMASFAKEMAR